jgi:hypothetical protein
LLTALSVIIIFYHKISSFGRRKRAFCRKNSTIGEKLRYNIYKEYIFLHIAFNSVIICTNGRTEKMKKILIFSFSLLFLLLDTSAIACTFRIRMNTLLTNVVTGLQVGWQGATVTVKVNGVTVLNNVTLNYGSSTGYTFDANTGDNITTFYTPGLYVGVNYYSIQNDNLVVQATDNNTGISADPSGLNIFPTCSNPAAPANDEPVGAIALSNTNYYPQTTAAGQWTIGNTRGSASSAAENTKCGATPSSWTKTPSHTIWYKFTATSTAQSVCLQSNVNFSLRSVSC